MRSSKVQLSFSNNSTQRQQATCASLAPAHSGLSQPGMNHLLVGTFDRTAANSITQP